MAHLIRCITYANIEILEALVSVFFARQESRDYSHEGLME